VIPAGANYLVRYEGYSSGIKDNTGAVVDLFEADYVYVVSNRSLGCDGIKGQVLIQGDLALTSPTDSVKFTYSQLYIGLTDSSSAGGCTQVITLNGTFQVDDTRLGEVIDNTFREFRMKRTRVDTGRYSVDLDGGLSAGCLGDIRLRTLRPIVVESRAACLSDGVLAVTLSDGSIGHVVYSTDGLGFDYDSDGEIDRTFDGCDDAMLAACP